MSAEDLPEASTGVPVPGAPVDLIAGQVPLSQVMAVLARERPVLHSEADLQHGFARVLWELDCEVRCRLEVRQTTSDGIEHLDLLCIGSRGRTAVEFKYIKHAWSGSVGAGPLGEQYVLKSHGATDEARRDFVFDIARLERFCERPDQNGLALMVTNEPALWRGPKPSGQRSRDHEFRLHQGGTLAGTLLWGGEDYPRNTRVLRGTYPLNWRPYSQQDGAGGVFQYLAVSIEPDSKASSGPAESGTFDVDPRT
ncbi:hypothetical protein [Peterkaempfera sp. SMS 1(5)a]|uniref:hypothetical protein n=1 Tax=Peterkaempfera podocarpi TaxID=3232308 RepID=UPI0036715130